jgi:hypothetical protein
MLAALKALRFHDGSALELEATPANAWPALLDSLDRAHLTLALGVRCRDSLPEFVSSRIDRNLDSNRERHQRLVAAQSEVTAALAAQGIEYVVLKGLSLWPCYGDDPGQRPQYDIDIYVPEASISKAADVVTSLGYEALSDKADSGADHLPVMIRKSGWTWRNDYYDAEMPLSLELHFRFWNPRMMRFDVENAEQFWSRRVLRTVGELEFATLNPVDGLSYSALHLVRHLLGGDLQLRHVYEMAHFLEKSASDDSFWSDWLETGLSSCRVIEGIAFRLAAGWFHCHLHPVARNAVDQLPLPVKRWFELFALSPSFAIDNRKKSELWLHFCLLDTARDRRAVAGRRLFPNQRSRVVLDAYVEPSKVGLRLRLRRRAYEASFLARRIAHHLRALAPVIRGAYRWWSGKHRSQALTTSL